MLRFSKCISVLLLVAAFHIHDKAAAQQSRQVRVTVNEGTNMAVALSPDARTLALDLQGPIWLVPGGGGEATAVTDEFSDAR